MAALAAWRHQPSLGVAEIGALLSSSHCEEMARMRRSPQRGCSPLSLLVPLLLATATPTSVHASLINVLANRAGQAGAQKHYRSCFHAPGSYVLRPPPQRSTCPVHAVVTLLAGSGWSQLQPATCKVIDGVTARRRERGDAEGAARAQELKKWLDVLGWHKGLAALGMQLFGARSALTDVWSLVAGAGRAFQARVEAGVRD